MDLRKRSTVGARGGSSHGARLQSRSHLVRGSLLVQGPLGFFQGSLSSENWGVAELRGTCSRTRRVFSKDPEGSFKLSLDNLFRVITSQTYGVAKSGFSRTNRLTWSENPEVYLSKPQLCGPGGLRRNHQFEFQKTVTHYKSKIQLRCAVGLEHEDATFQTWGAAESVCPKTRRVDLLSDPTLKYDKGLSQTDCGSVFHQMCPCCERLFSYVSKLGDAAILRRM